MKHFVFVLLSVLLLFSTGYSEDKNIPPADYKGSVAERPILKQGDRWDYTRREKVVSCEFMGEKDGQLVFYITWDDGTKETEFRTSDQNFLKGLDTKGEIHEEVAPFRGWLSFPLWVGKKWSYTFQTSNTRRASSMSSNIDSDVKVVGYEQIKVPAGTLWAFKIEEVRKVRGAKKGPGANGIHITAWYNPDIKGSVKIEHDNDVYNRDLVKFTPAK